MEYEQGFDLVEKTHLLISTNHETTYLALLLSVVGVEAAQLFPILLSLIVVLEFSLTFKGKQTFRLQFGKEKMEAELFTPDVLLLNGYQLDIVRDQEGTLSHILLFDDRLQQVRFDPFTP